MAASTTPEIALGFTLKYDDVGATTFANALGRIRSISGHEVSCDNVDVSSSDDTMMQYLPGISTEAVRRITMLYDETKMEIIEGFYRVSKNWRITTAGGATLTGAGYICKYGIPLEYRGELRIEIEIMPQTALWAYVGTA